MTSERDDDTPADANESMASWPSAPAPGESFFGSGWHRPASASASTGSGASDEVETADSEATFWQETATDAWPSSPAETKATADSQEPAAHETPRVEAEADAVDGTVDVAAGEAVARAERLLDELREIIGAVGRGATPDLSGVISDLEVAVTPPGAVAPDAVSELREALLTARERPRDLDTIVDLTQRIDALLALIIAYDRAIAAIERSLDALRSTSHVEVSDERASG